MDPLAPPLKAVLEIRLQIENGTSIMESIRCFTKKYPEDSFAKNLGLYFFQKEMGKSPSFNFDDKPYRQLLCTILARGLEGEPILEHLKEFEADLCIATHEDLEKHIQKLPFLSLIPLMLFQFPAFILILLGPLLIDLLTALQN